MPIAPGFRNQINTGLQQAISKWMIFDADYFWKYTHNAYDFSTLLNTTITFPIAWHNSKLDGITGRVSTTNLHGFQAYWTFGHTRARYFPPEVGGLVPQGAPLVAGVFRIDHDQAFNQQVTIGLACAGVYATAATPITSCNGPVTSKLLRLPQAGQENDDHNPDRVKPRHLIDLGIGSDNLFHTEKRQKVTASLSITNLANKVAVYNFLSTFSGTHFLQPRTFVARLGLSF